MDYIKILSIEIKRENFEDLDDINTDYQNLGIADEANLPQDVEEKLIEIEDFVNNCCPECYSSNIKHCGSTGQDSKGREMEADWNECKECGEIWND